MEHKKRFLQVLSIALMLSVFSPLNAKGWWRKKYERAAAKAALYKRCSQGLCSETDKKEVWEDFKKGIKVTGLLAAIAVIGGGFWLSSPYRKGLALRNEAYKWSGLGEKIKLGWTSGDNIQKMGIWFRRAVDPTVSDEALKAELSGGWYLGSAAEPMRRAAAYIYYRRPPIEAELVEFDRKFLPHRRSTTN